VTHEDSVCTVKDPTVYTIHYRPFPLVILPS
jgi:hypothetical protein